MTVKIIMLLSFFLLNNELINFNFPINRDFQIKLLSH